MRAGSQCDPLIAGDNEPTLGTESPGCWLVSHPTAGCRTVPLKGEMLVGQCGRRLRLKVDHVDSDELRLPRARGTVLTRHRQLRLAPLHG